MKEKCECKGLHIPSFGLALGILWAIILFIMAVFAGIAGGYGIGFVDGVGSIYIGYHPTFIGALIGAAWGFLDGFIGGMLFAWFYNAFARKFCRSKTASNK